MIILFFLLVKVPIPSIRCMIIAAAQIICYSYIGIFLTSFHKPKFLNVKQKLFTIQNTRAHTNTQPIHSFTHTQRTQFEKKKPSIRFCVNDFADNGKKLLFLINTILICTIKKFIGIVLELPKSAFRRKNLF